MELLFQLWHSCRGGGTAERCKKQDWVEEWKGTVENPVTFNPFHILITEQIVRDIKLDCFTISVAKMATNLHLAHKIPPVNKHQIKVHTSTSSALPIPPEEYVTVQLGTRATGRIPPGFTYASDVKSLQLGYSFGHLLFVPHSAGISVEGF
ncbi:hypothetical protein DUI87_16847 [Hirundo rustica rustica]|uniref:Uncharacterized protein n=1 Tax=Hirundo rustica rustica TaxID=333673 RepID=A0A3M0K2F3_HIRRU|nr:hypothetical protein DUI87_16847 [Hirundo rustica rustica]